MCGKLHANMIMGYQWVSWASRQVMPLTHLYCWVVWECSICTSWTRILGCSQVKLPQSLQAAAEETGYTRGAAGLKPHIPRRIDPEEFLHVTKFHVFKVFHFKSLTLRTNIATRNSHFEDVVPFKQGGICELHGGYFALCHHGSSLFPVVIDPVGKLAKVRTIQKSVVKMQVCGQGARNIWMIVYVNL